jgi:short-subunit dehydrogenase
MAYALVTGATKGIGKAIAEELAKRKINVLLTARSKDLLEELAQYLSHKYKIQANYLVADLSIAATPKTIFEWCCANSFIVNILINNAGYGLQGRLEKHSLTEHLDMIHVNVIAAVELTYLFLPVLKTQEKSYIMNVASTASYQSVPGMNLYAASKAFISSFSRGLRHELKCTNISVTLISPGATDTDFIHRANIKSAKALKLSKMFNMQPERVAAIAVKKLFADRAEVIVGFINKLSVFFVWLFPKSFSEKLAAKIYDE